MTMRASAVAVALCLLGALVPAMAGVDAAPMFAEWFHAQKAGPSTRAKAMGGRQETHKKHICLQEKLQYNCRDIGCNNVVYFPEGNCTANSTCGACTHGNFWQSDLTCCGERNSYGYGDEEETGGFGTGLSSPTLKIGTCDWNVNLYDVGQPSTDGSVSKLGTAWATCFLTNAAEYCGTDLLCDQMVLSFKGGLYQAWVRSTQPEDLQIADESLSCLPDDVFVSGFPLSDSARRSANRRSTRRRNNGIPTTDGLAEMISGVVTITSMDRVIEYDTGYMDYVVMFTSFNSTVLAGAGLPSPLPADKYPTVTPNVYNIRLTSNKAFETSQGAEQR